MKSWLHITSLNIRIYIYINRHIYIYIYLNRHIYISSFVYIGSESCDRQLQLPETLANIFIASRSRSLSSSSSAHPNKNLLLCKPCSHTSNSSPVQLSLFESEILIVISWLLIQNKLWPGMPSEKILTKMLVWIFDGRTFYCPYYSFLNSVLDHIQITSILLNISHHHTKYTTTTPLIFNRYNLCIISSIIYRTDKYTFQWCKNYVGLRTTVEKATLHLKRNTSK